MEAKLSTILDNAIAAIASLRVFADRTWEYEYRSAGCKAVFGYSAAELMADPNLWHSRVYHEDIERVILKTFEEVFSVHEISPQETHAITLEYRFWHKDGSLHWISESLTSRQDVNANCWVVTIVSTDISERKRVEEALKLSEERYALATHKGNIATWEYYPKTRQVYRAPQWKELAGYTDEEIGDELESWKQLIHPDDHELLEQTVLGYLKGAIPACEMECRLLHKDGSLRWVLIRAYAFQNESGDICKLSGVGIDITDLKQAEEKLQAQMQRDQSLRLVIQAIRNSLDLTTVFSATVSEVGALLNMDHVVIMQYLADRQVWLHQAEYRKSLEYLSTKGLEVPDQNNSLAQQLHQSEIVCVNDVSHLQDEVIQELAKKFPGAWLLIPLQANKTTWGCLVMVKYQQPYSWQDPDVELAREVADQLAIAIQQSQLYQQVQQLNSDLENQVHLRTAQLQQAYEFEATLKQITDKVRDSLDEEQILQGAIAALAQSLGVDGCNAALFDLEQGTSTVHYEYTTSISPYQGRVSRLADFPELYSPLLEGQHFQFCSLVPNPKRGRAAMLACPILDNQGVLGDLWLVNPPDYCFSEQEIRLVQQVANQCAIALRQSRLYQTAQMQVTELERLNRLKDDFLSTVSHELRTPMANIKMATQMLEISLRKMGMLFDAATTETKAVNRYFQILKDECQREINLVNDLLDLSRLDAGNTPVSPTSLDVRSWITKITEPFIERARSQQQRLEINLPQDLPILTTDFSYLEGILAELLDNACKYTPTGESITLSAQATATQFCLSIANSGVEIPPSEQARIFDKFYRIPNNDPWKHGGTGLGLALLQQRVEQLSGSIQVASGQGQTVFTLQLPHSIP